jgi:hypothetical protein
MTTRIQDRPAPPERSVLVVTAEANRAFRSTTRTIVGILREGQLGDRCRDLDARPPIGSVTLEAIADRPDRPIKDGEEALVEDLALAPPSVLVAMDPMAGVLISRWASELGDPLTVGMVGSLWVDPLWRAAALDRWIVPDQTIARVLLEDGCAPEGLVPIGLGVCGRFGIGVREGRSDCRKSLGLDLDRPVLLFAAETLWADDLAPWLEAIARTAPNITLLIDAAGDRLLLAEARRLHAQLGLAGRVFGRVDEAGLYWGSADRVVCRALDGLVTRALAFHCPLWAIRPTDDRQRGILAGLEQLDAGGPVTNPDDLAAQVATDGWSIPLDGSRMETLAGAAVPGRIADAITQMAAEHNG